MCITWCRFRIQICTGIKMESRIRIRIWIKTMPIHKTGWNEIEPCGTYSLSAPEDVLSYSNGVLPDTNVVGLKWYQLYCRSFSNVHSATRCKK